MNEFFITCDHRKDKQDENDLKKRFNILSGRYDMFIICYEYLPDNPHYHLYMKTDIEKNTLRAQLKKVFHDTNVSFSTKEWTIESKVRSIAYILKGGSYLQKGMSFQDLVDAKSISFKKRMKLKLHLNLLKDKYIKGVITRQEFVKEYVDAYVVEYRTAFNYTAIRNQILSTCMLVDKKLKTRVVDKLLYDVDCYFN